MSQVLFNANIKTIENPLPIDLNGNVLTVIAKSPLPPGSRVDVKLSSSKNPSKVSVAGKIATLDSLGEAGFKIKIRLHSVTKEQEDLLNSILSETM